MKKRVVKISGRRLAGSLPPTRFESHYRIGCQVRLIVGRAVTIDYGKALSLKFLRLHISYLISSLHGYYGFFP